LTHHDEIDARIAEYTAEHDDYDLMHRLQAAGIAATPVLEASRMFDDPHLRARNFFQTQTQKASGTYEYVGPLWQLPGTPVEFSQPPVMFGEHNEYVYREVLRLSEDEYQALLAAGHIADAYDPSVP
jgi:crotonobetainyl-CoA:carnitine CoA-transferase CaiB-like acyl-CoA transferase